MNVPCVLQPHAQPVAPPGSGLNTLPDLAPDPSDDARRARNERLESFDVDELRNYAHNWNRAQRADQSSVRLACASVLHGAGDRRHCSHPLCDRRRSLKNAGHRSADSCRCGQHGRQL